MVVEFALVLVVVHDSYIFIFQNNQNIPNLDRKVSYMRFWMCKCDD